MSRLRQTLYLLPFSIFFVANLCAQTTNSALINGREYLRIPYYIAKGTPYFRSDTLVAGEVIYKGSSFTNVPLMYDELTDRLITTDRLRKNLIELVSAHVTSFRLHNTAFVYLGANAAGVAEGYYQVLHEGKYRLLKKESKRIVDDVRAGEQLQRSIVGRSYYYLNNGSSYVPITGFRSLQEFFVKDEAMSRYLKTQRTKYRNAALEDILVDALSHYTQPSN